MPGKFTDVDAAIAALIAQVTETEGVAASATVALNNALDLQAKAVADALAADNAVDDATAARINAVVAATTTRLKVATDPLGAAVAANPTPTP